MGEGNGHKASARARARNTIITVQAEPRLNDDKLLIGQGKGVGRDGYMALPPQLAQQLLSICKHHASMHEVCQGRLSNYRANMQGSCQGWPGNAMQEACQCGPCIRHANMHKPCQHARNVPACKIRARQIANNFLTWAKGRAGGVGGLSHCCITALKFLAKMSVKYFSFLFNTLA